MTNLPPARKVAIQNFFKLNQDVRDLSGGSASLLIPVSTNYCVKLHYSSPSILNAESLEALSYEISLLEKFKEYNMKRLIPTIPPSTKC